MKEISFNDGIGNRGLNSMLVLFSQTDSVLTEFLGENIKGLAVIVKKDYNKNGKWSSNTFTIRIPDNVVAFRWTQDWDMGTYLVGEDWQEAYNHFILASEFPCDFETFERFVYFRFPKMAKIFCETAEDLSTVGEESLASIRELQSLQMDIEKNIIAQELKNKKTKIAEETTKRLEKVLEISQKLKGKMTLEDLKELMKECQ